MSSNIESGLTLEPQNVSADPAERSPHVPTLPFAFARRFGVVLDSRPNDSGAYEVAAKTQPRLSTLAEIRRITQHSTVIRIVAEGEFDQLLSAAYSQDSSEAKQMVEDLGGEMDLASLASALPKTEDLLDQADDAPIIRLINALLSEAIRENASDVHIETFDKALVVRFRVDGVMREVVRPRRELASLLVSRIKVMARLDIAEKRVPQDGRISLLLGGREVDVRVSTMPASAGERVVMRLLDKQAGRLQLQRLGLQTHTLEALQNVVHKPHGIFLVTGPTGSGKTTTLYSALSELNEPDDKIITTEDPIEYDIEGIVQVPIDSDIGVTFAAALRAILRQDPDRILVGEIRDVETAEIAIQAALTGHMVFSTLHTNDSPATVTRLRDMGVQPFLITATVEAILAQRLVRRICSECKEEFIPDADTLADLELTSDQVVGKTFFRGRGCDKCSGSGYKGRLGLYELLVMTDELRDLVVRNASTEEIRDLARKAGMVTLRDSGMVNMFEGHTTADEVIRETILEA